MQRFFQTEIKGVNTHGAYVSPAGLVYQSKYIKVATSHMEVLGALF